MVLRNPQVVLRQSKRKQHPTSPLLLLLHLPRVLKPRAMQRPSQRTRRPSQSQRKRVKPSQRQRKRVIPRLLNPPQVLGRERVLVLGLQSKTEMWKR